MVVQVAVFAIKNWFELNKNNRTLYFWSWIISTKHSKRILLDSSNNCYLHCNLIGFRSIIFALSRLRHFFGCRKVFIVEWRYRNSNWHYLCLVGFFCFFFLLFSFECFDKLRRQPGENLIKVSLFQSAIRSSIRIDMIKIWRCLR